MRLALPSLRRLSRAAILAIALAPTVLGAQAAPGKRLVFDNDALDIWLPSIQRPDGEYTHGLRLSVALRSAPWWGRHLAPRLAPCAPGASGDLPCLTTELALGQKIFTPNSTEPVAPLDGDRSYAGWLYASATAHVIAPRRLRSLGVELGVTGPPSLAGNVQRGFHELLGNSKPPEGWRYQLGFQPGARLSYVERYRAALTTKSGVPIADLLPGWAVEVGNVRDELRAGAELRVGWNVPHPWRSTARGAPGFAVYALVAASERWRAYDEFLDRAYTVGDSVRRIEKSRWVNDYTLGVGTRLGSLTLEFRGITQGREYRTGPNTHPYASLVATIAEH